MSQSWARRRFNALRYDGDPPPPKKHVREVENSEAIPLRRFCAASGNVSADIAKAFTQGEFAALNIVARQSGQHGACLLAVDRIAELAGVSRSTVKNAIRKARRLRVIEYHERQSLTNVLTFIGSPP